MAMLAMFEPYLPGRCDTCTRPVVAPARFCSYWCHLVENGPAFFTLETITPWLLKNRQPLTRTAQL